MSMSINAPPPTRSPYAKAPVQVAHAFVAGREAHSAEDCPFDSTIAPNEHDAWHRGFKVARLIGDAL